MDTNQHIYAAFHLGQISRNEGRPDQSIFHFTRALDVFHSTVGSFRDPFFWSKLLFARAEAYLLCGKYSSMNCDIQRALTDCPNKLDDLVSFIQEHYCRVQIMLQIKTALQKL